MEDRKRHAGVLIGALTVLFVTACTDAKWNGSLEEFLKSQSGPIGQVMKDPQQYRLQVIYTQIDRDERNRPSFTSFGYRVDAGEYFYPASTVKLPTALIALEKLNTLAIAGLDRDTPMLTAASADYQGAALSDHSSPHGMPSVAHYTRKILLVSDNDAFNRLYEFVGQQPLNEALHAKGLVGTRIMHRLELTLDTEQNRHTNPIVFAGDDGIVYEQAAQYSQRDYTVDAPVLLGSAEIVDGQRLERPKDFAGKNAFPLQDQHDVIKALMFPESVPAQRRFGLSADDYGFVYRYMSMYPSDSGIAAYADAGAYPDSHVKFLMYGGTARSIPAHIRIFNKVGDAYGFLTDAAYVADLKNGVEFILAATIYTNENGTFNDDTYEYEERGLPFLRDLGQSIYGLELARERAYRPDFSHFFPSEQRPDR